MADQRPRPTADSEKITINLGVVDLGQIDLLVLDHPVIDILEQIANAGSVELEVEPGLDLQRRVSMNFTDVPIRTVLLLLASETDTVITPHADGIRVHRAAPTLPAA